MAFSLKLCRQKKGKGYVHFVATLTDQQRALGYPQDFGEASFAH